MSEKEQFDQFEAWWKTLNIYDPTLKALCGSAWMQAIRSTSVTTAAGCCCAAEVTDRRGVVLVPGQKVFVLQTEQTRIATVVEVTEKRSSNGWWVDVDFGSGSEGIPSDILEVCNAPATPSADGQRTPLSHPIYSRVRLA